MGDTRKEVICFLGAHVPTRINTLSPVPFPATCLALTVIIWFDSPMLWFLSTFATSEEPTHNRRSKYATQVQQRPESPTVTLAWHACKYKVHKLHRRCIDPFVGGVHVVVFS